MSSVAVNEGLRTKKTEKAVYAALFSLLGSLSFRKITVKGICEEALISRAAFYAHFVDKYDLLKHWLKEVWPKIFGNNQSYEQMEETVNYYINRNVLVIQNLVYDADDETHAVLFEFMLSTINLSVEKKPCEEMHHKNIVLSSFYAGGAISYLLWQVRNKFPPDIPLMNRTLYDILHEFRIWQSK